MSIPRALLVVGVLTPASFIVSPVLFAQARSTTTHPAAKKNILALPKAEE